MAHEEWVVRMATDALHSPKYKHICPDTLQAMAMQEVQRGHGHYREAENAYRKRLHQLWGSYVDGRYAQKASAMLEAATCNHDHILALHASSRERLPYYKAFYNAVWDATGTPETLLDVACGLNPFALPYMSVQPQRYIALDVDGQAAMLCNRWFAMQGLPQLARCDDALVRPLKDIADVALVLKLLPLLEYQVQDGPAHLLSALQARYVVVSYPLQSLGGRHKGQRSHYEEMMTRHLVGFPMVWQGVIGNELVAIIRKEETNA